MTVHVAIEDKDTIEIKEFTNLQDAFRFCREDVEARPGFDHWISVDGHAAWELNDIPQMY